jgi:hypothetical protein
MDAPVLIDELGGVTKVARLCDIKPPSVDGWRDNGVPKAREMYFRALAQLRPDIATAVQRADAAARKRKRKTA